MLWGPVVQWLNARLSCVRPGFDARQDSHFRRLEGQIKENFLITLGFEPTIAKNIQC